MQVSDRFDSSERWLWVVVRRGAVNGRRTVVGWRWWQGEIQLLVARVTKIDQYERTQ